ncbi:uncharacterized protein ASCRUDRAFT_78173 [Ascoidea rubescens DSM 1968]|uniref:Uncharacterized protein n=1 Tax=Ascoidea rubescens DSM 1968 TaxID=1344418 RepID=A0A1D2V8U7_9ASCO|nr:hypothetical protein ASCRUDRAFT_78173 [Ascoidea rubescens DSM 1968]ODV58054.1 hypothetical protein ASCRUDRAFT_78173 [Ascoidea rubescens DSM 1968]
MLLLLPEMKQAQLPYNSRQQKGKNTHNYCLYLSIFLQFPLLLLAHSPSLVSTTFFFPSLSDWSLDMSINSYNQLYSQLNYSFCFRPIFNDVSIFSTFSNNI